MKFKLISCNVFQRELHTLIPQSPHEIETEFLELGEHVRPGELRKKLQSRIDAAADFDAVLLGYGLCGTAADGLAAGAIPVVLPRSHDCCGILLGSRKRFEEYFAAMPSTPFSSVGYVEHGNYYFADGEMLLGDSYASLVEQYGEEDARYIYEAMHPKLDGVYQPVCFISNPEIPDAAEQAICRAKADGEGREFRLLAGDLRLLRALLAGDWPADEFLVLRPGETVRQAGDWDEIVRAVSSASV